MNGCRRSTLRIVPVDVLVYMSVVHVKRLGLTSQKYESPLTQLKLASVFNKKTFYRVLNEFGLGCKIEWIVTVRLVSLCAFFFFLDRVFHS